MIFAEILIGGRSKVEELVFEEGSLGDGTKVDELVFEEGLLGGVGIIIKGIITR